MSTDNTTLRIGPTPVFVSLCALVGLLVGAAGGYAWGLLTALNHERPGAGCTCPAVNHSHVVDNADEIDILRQTIKSLNEDLTEANRHRRIGSPPVGSAPPSN